MDAAVEYGLAPVGVREAKARFSALTEAVNDSGVALTVLKNNRPWVVIQPADAKTAERRRRLESFRALTARIESDADEPEWGGLDHDRELLAEERMARFG